MLKKTKKPKLFSSHACGVVKPLQHMCQSQQPTLKWLESASQSHRLSSHSFYMLCQLILDVLLT